MVESIRSNTIIPHRIIVLDDGSIASEKDKIKQLRDNVDHLYFLPHVGYSKAVVRSFDYATSDPFIISDGDINAPPHWLQTLLNKRNRDKFAILALNTQMNSSIVLGKDNVRVYNSISTTGNRTKHSEGLGIDCENIAEVHCAPLWLALVSKQVGEVLNHYKFGICHFKDNPDLVYSNLLRLEGLRTGIALDIRGVHTGLGWNRGYPASLYKGEKYYRPNIPCTEEGIPVYRNLTKEHWYDSKYCIRQYTLDNVHYNYREYEVQSMFVTAIHIMHGYIPMPKNKQYQETYKELCSYMSERI